MTGSLLQGKVNTALWEYVEVLEGSVTELFQQLSLVRFEQWRPELMNVVEFVRKSLLERIDEVDLVIEKMETLLWDYRLACESRVGKVSLWERISFYWKTLLDRSLHSYLRKSRRFLKIHSKWFAQKIWRLSETQT